MVKDQLGDQLKLIEQAEAGRKAVKGKPIIARLDGRGFSNFTRGLKRPYDERMSKLMIDTVSYLVEHTHPLVGYTQSDEISLVWFEEEDSVGQYLFDGKYQKLTSTLAAMATAYFNSRLKECLPEKAHLLPTFDARVWQPTDMHEAFLNFVWRQDDAIKNSISMAAQSVYSHRQLEGVNSTDKRKMLIEKGIDWNLYPTFFKMGTFVKRNVKMINLTELELQRIPVQHRPEGPILRTVVEELSVEYLMSYSRTEARSMLFKK